MAIEIPKKIWDEMPADRRYGCVWCGHKGPFTLLKLYWHTVEDCDKSPAHNIKRCNDKLMTKIDGLMTKIDGLQARIDQLERGGK